MQSKHRARSAALVLAAVAAVLALAAPGAQAQSGPQAAWGYADLHAHQFAHLGFGGLVIWGQPFEPGDDIAKALPWSDFMPAAPGEVVNGAGQPVGLIPNIGIGNVPATCPPGTGRVDNPCWGVWVHGPGGIFDLLNTFLSGSVGHLVGGYPQFDGYPRWNTYTGQQMYYRWLERAYQGGLRLMVMLGVNNEALCKAVNRRAAYGCDDMPALARQVQATKDLEAFIDAQHGGPGQGWFRIAYSAQQARSILASGKLVVVLGVEMPSLFGCKTLAGCTPQQVQNEIANLHGAGVRHVFPIHNADNAFGGTALYEQIMAFNNKIINNEWWSVGGCASGSNIDFHLGLLDTINDAGNLAAIVNPFLFSVAQQTGALPPRPPAGPNCNTRGLSSLGEVFVNGLIDRQMVIDVDHMSSIALNRTMQIAEARKYPGLAMSHTGFVEMSKAGVNKKHEGNKTPQQVERLRQLGGMLGVILHQGSRGQVEEYRRADGSAPVPFDCGSSSKAWAQSYLYAIDKMQGAAVAIGSDFNGLAGLLAPRHGGEACGGDKPGGYAPGAGVSYPFQLHGQAATMDRQVVGSKTFDFNTDGLANVGLLPDFVEDLKAVGLSNTDLNPLFRSAEAYVRMWEVASDTTPPAIQCGSADGAWHAGNVAISCTASDAVAGLANAGDAAFTLSTSVAAGTETSAAATGTRTVCDRRGNCATAGPIGGNKVDRKAPSVSCASADGVWHATNVSLGCTASDGGSGLQASGDASFSLATTVPAGVETATAATGSRSVCDAVGNCATAGPVDGNKIDRKAPSVSIVQPAAGDYLNTATLTLDYSTADGGSGVGSVTPTLDAATTVAGHGLADGQAIDLLTEVTLGPHTFAVTAVDAVGNVGSEAVVFEVIVTAASVIEALERFGDQGAIRNAGLEQSLLAKLRAAKAARARGDCATAANVYRAMENELRAQSGKGVTAAAAGILSASAAYLRTHCP